MRHGNVNAEIVYVRAALAATVSEPERAVRAARSADNAMSAPRGLLRETAWVERVFRVKHKIMAHIRSGEWMAARRRASP